MSSLQGRYIMVKTIKTGRIRIEKAALWLFESGQEHTKKKKKNTKQTTLKNVQNLL